MVGDHQVGLGRGAAAALDEASAEMRAGGIDAFAAPVSQPGEAAAPEQPRQPARQVAADHVAIPAIRCPARHQLGEQRGAVGEAALRCILEIEQAEIILAPLAHHHPPPPRLRVSNHPRRLAVELALQVAGIGAQPDAALRRFGPADRRRQIAERLADAGAGLGQHDMRLAIGATRLEGLHPGFGISALAAAHRVRRADDPRQPVGRRRRIDHHRRRCRAQRLCLPFRQAGIEAALRLGWALQLRSDDRRPAPAMPRHRLQDGMGAVPRRPAGVAQRRQ